VTIFRLHSSKIVSLSKYSHPRRRYKSPPVLLGINIKPWFAGTANAFTVHEMLVFSSKASGIPFPSRSPPFRSKKSSAVESHHTALIRACTRRIPLLTSPNGAKLGIGVVTHPLKSATSYAGTRLKCCFATGEEAPRAALGEVHTLQAYNPCSSLVLLHRHVGWNLSKWRDAELLDILSRRWDVHILIPFRR
jgi:hypothetical protein